MQNKRPHKKMGYRNDQINEWGSYEDRKDSYDDDSDLNIFKEMVQTNSALRSYIKRHTDLDQFTDTASLKTKPNGPYGVDMGVYDERKNHIANLDVERWDKWDDDWPDFYRHISFLTRKLKFVEEDKQFFMAYLNRSRNKVLMITKESFPFYDNKVVYFKNGFKENKKEIPFDYGTIFGENITEKEKELFSW